MTGTRAVLMFRTSVQHKGCCVALRMWHVPRPGAMLQRYSTSSARLDNFAASRGRARPHLAGGPVEEHEHCRPANGDGGVSARRTEPTMGGDGQRNKHRGNNGVRVHVQTFFAGLAIG